jgi:predicted  nucleic acid-binding Zn-ribbon protein
VNGNGSKDAAEVERLRREIDRLIARIRQLENDVADRDDVIEGLRARIRRLEDEIRRLKDK